MWDKDRAQGPVGRVRLKETVTLIPVDAHSILDVGCGNGFLVNELTGRYSGRFVRITALDSSGEALKHVKCEKVKGSAAELPFEDGSYDLVTALEVLEHLQEEDFKRALWEIQRVSRKYIIVSVPNNQDLLLLLVMCPKCSCCYNPSYHVRSFSKRTLVSLFSTFRLKRLEEVGPLTTLRSRSRGLVYPYLCYKLFYRKTKPPSYAICPQCGYQHQLVPSEISYDTPWTRSSKLLSLAKYLIDLTARKEKARPYLLALYEKETTET